MTETAMGGGGSIASRTMSPIRRAARLGCELAVAAGMPPALSGFRGIRPVSAAQHVARVQARGGPASFEMIHDAARATNALPFTAGARNDLPRDAGWWGYSMYDVPDRASDETWIATIPGGRVVTTQDARQKFYPAILTCDGRAINLREMKFRNMHSEALRSRPPVRRLKRATWICERVYDNHSHWLTAHLPKLVMLKRRGELGDVLLPETLTAAMEASLRMLGLTPADFARFTPGEVIEAEHLTIMSTDRFRAELLNPVRDEIAPVLSAPAGRRIFVSRGKAKMRKLANEDAVWPLFEAAGFEKVYMEDHDFPAQVAMMQASAVLAAPHGAGLTNMMFCPPGAQVLEIAWLGFPNPNFYALAAAMGLHYGLISAEPHGQSEMLLERDMTVEPDAVAAALARMELNVGRPSIIPGT